MKRTLAPPFKQPSQYRVTVRVRGETQCVLFFLIPFVDIRMVLIKFVHFSLYSSEIYPAEMVVE